MLYSHFQQNLAFLSLQSCPESFRLRVWCCESVPSQSKPECFAVIGQFTWWKYVLTSTRELDLFREPHGSRKNHRNISQTLSYLSTSFHNTWPQSATDCRQLASCSVWKVYSVPQQTRTSLNCVNNETNASFIIFYSVTLLEREKRFFFNPGLNKILNSCPLRWGRVYLC